jgi:UDP-N-acetylglucosamine--N-acetylmuramyl-(pentapeptide) pyrophosphoryl-undecaprenol N-acetylglucosamine transferase
MRVVISAGGTGGHIYPALAIINKIKSIEPNSEFLYIGTHNRMEKDIIPKYNIPFKTLEIYGFYRKEIFKNFKTISKLISAYKQSKKMIKEFNPDIVIGVGGYVTVPVILSARRLKYKTVIHEQNSVPGLSNKILSFFVDKILVSFSSSIKHFPKKKVIFTGNPCSEDALNKEPFTKSSLGLNDNLKLVYIVMGSLGSSYISDFMIKTLKLFKDKNYEVIFVTGSGSYESVSQNTFPDNVKIFPYIEDQTRAFQLADLIVTRCGASTLSEIVALEKPSILIPSPYVPNNHQYKNALDFIKEEAAVLLEEVDLKENRLINLIDEIIFDEERLLRLKAGLYKMQTPNSATKIYENIKEMIL